MKFLDRALRLVRADAHGVIDQLEEQSLLLKQHLREAEVELTRKRVRAEALEEEERQLAREIKQAECQLSRLDEDVELAQRPGICIELPSGCRSSMFGSVR